MSDVVWMDDNGFRVDNPVDATFGEITLDNGTRVYVDPAVWSNDGEEQANSLRPDDVNLPWTGTDLIKANSWDVRTPEHEVVTTLAQLLSSLGVSGWPIEAQVGEIERFVKLPAWVPAPIELRREVLQWLRTNANGAATE